MSSAYNELAAPAPKVEEAIADRAVLSEELTAEPARATEQATAEPARNVEPAVTDEHHIFAPPISKQEASHLSVAALRGSGADFEGKAGVIRGRVEKNFLRRCLPILFDERDFVSMGEVLRFVFVKANCIFIYGQETDPSPLYAIPLDTVIATKEDPKNPDKESFTISPTINTNETADHLVTILLKDRATKKQAYQFTFDTSGDKGIAKRCLDVINYNTRHYSSPSVRASVINAKVAGDVVMSKSERVFKA